MTFNPSAEDMEEPSNEIMKLDNLKIEFIINCDVEEMVSFLQEDHGMKMLEAFDTVYNSKTYKKLTDTETGLYVQSPRHIYAYLKEEIEGGKTKACPFTAK